MRSRRTLAWSVSFLAVLAVAAAARGAAVGQILDLDGRPLNPFAPAGAANVIFFVATDCPISNRTRPRSNACAGNTGPAASAAP